MGIEQITEPFEIDAGAPTPAILSNENQIYLIFYKSDVDPNWDGSTVHMRTNNEGRNTENCKTSLMLRSHLNTCSLYSKTPYLCTSLTNWCRV